MTDQAPPPVSIREYEERARGVLPRMASDYYTAGAEDERTIADLPVVGARDRDARNAFTIPSGMGYANLSVTRPPESQASDLATFIAFQGDPSLNWNDVEWLRSLTDLPFILKGVVTEEDAARAVDAGFEGIVVSNHGGRQLDGTIASLDALPEVVAAVDGRAEVLLDGGVRRGTDVLKALALGARAVMVGRPVLWGLAVGGESGVRHVLHLLEQDLDVAMAIAGCRTLSDVTPALVRPAPREACARGPAHGLHP